MIYYSLRNKEKRMDGNYEQKINTLRWELPL